MMSHLLWKVSEHRTAPEASWKGKSDRPASHSTPEFAFGGEIFSWSYREPKLKPRPLVVIADISGSMERYTRLLLHFIYGMKAALSQPVEAFVFSTRLTRYAPASGP